MKAVQIQKYYNKKITEGGLSSTQPIIPNTGGVEYDPATNTMNFLEFQIQDSKCIDNNEYVYTRLSISQSIDLDKLKKDLEEVGDKILKVAVVVAIGVAILVVAPEAIAAAVAAVAAASALPALGVLGSAAGSIALAPAFA
ncbi:hypothetical protein SDC9_60579 [bioreactor metagenome]|uniref:Uncharacterized protein n=1 Tax=bioreactor metagenome TaxID=1076179 RepID=A0A644XEL7_9ZZZZ